MNIRKTAQIATAGILVVAGLAIAAPASASTAEDGAEVRAWLTSWSVPDWQQDAIVKDLSKGILPESAQSDSAPVSSKTRSDEGYDELIERFQDGSVRVTGVEKGDEVKPGEIAPRSISSCTYYNSSGYVSATNCRIYQSSDIGTIEFRANYWRTASQSNVSNAREASFNTRYGTATQPTVKVVRASGNSSNPAVATAHSKYTSHNGASSEDVYLSLRVLPSKAYTTTY